MTKTRIDVALAILAIILVLIVGLDSSCDDATTVERIERAMMHVIRHGVPAHKIKPWPRHPFAADDAGRREFSSAVVEAGEARGVSPYLLTAIGFREGSFIGRRVGLIGETTAFQITPRTLRTAQKLDERCEPTTYKGGAFCAAALLAMWRRKCGSIEGAVSMYASGRTCTPDTEHLAWVVRDRIELARWMEGVR